MRDSDITMFVEGDEEEMVMNVKLFAGLAERVGSRVISLQVGETPTVHDIKQEMIHAYPDLKSEISHCLAAVNRTYADDHTSVRQTDEIALIPPVGGGSADEPQSCRIVDEPLDIAAAFQQLENVHCGGTVLFVGTVREWTKGRQTASLEYEAYVEMAIPQMKRIEEEVKQQFPGVLTLQWHRIGHLLPTDVAVICAAASPHRNAAFDAARLLIERLKKEVPIWKRENYVNGEAVWQANES